MKKQLVVFSLLLALGTGMPACGDDDNDDDVNSGETGGDDTGTGDEDTGTGDGDTEDTETAFPQLSGNPCSDENPWGCQPVTNEGCEGMDVACDWTYHPETLDVLGFFCVSESTMLEGEGCNQDLGPWCAAGHTCLVFSDDPAPDTEVDTESDTELTGICAKYCCSDDDCAEDQSCTSPKNYWEFVTMGKLGICR